MALVVSTLQNKLKSLVVNSNNFPKSYELAASNFGNAVNDYGSLATPPTPIAKLLWLRLSMLLVKWLRMEAVQRLGQLQLQWQ